jgi:hypothetical protein
MSKGSFEIKVGLAEMLKGGVIMDVTNSDPNEHRDVDLIGTLLFNLELIDDGDSSGAEHEVDPDAPKQGRFEQRCESSSV